jgi:parvulin-like peptidyl-prolyl isomerase
MMNRVCFPASCGRVPAVVALLFALFAFQLGAREFGDSIVALVGDRVITVYELHRLSRQEEESLRKMYSGDELTQKIIDLRKNVAREIVDRELLAMEFDALGATVPVDMVQERVDRAVRRESGGNRQEFEKKLAAANMTMAEFEERMRKEVAADLLLREKVMRRIRISPKQIEEYYKDNAKALQQPEKHRLEVIMLRTGDVDKTAAEIREKLRQGVPFAALAKQYSEGPNAEAGGDNGWMADLNAPFQDAIAGIKPGDVSPKNVKIGDKTYIVRLADWRAGGVPPLSEELRKQIEETLRREEQQRRYDAYLGELREKYYVVTADSLAE